MKTFVLLRLILRTLRDFTRAAAGIQTELRSLNATLNSLLLIQAKQAHYFPTAAAVDPPRRPQTVAGQPANEALIFAVVEEIRTRLQQDLGREPFEEEVFKALEEHQQLAGSRVG